LRIHLSDFTDIDSPGKDSSGAELCERVSLLQGPWLDNPQTPCLA
jgi:hypothetical protein